jgi:hypothetical protein
MRDIKFRGIKKETREWLYGGYFSNTDEEGLEHFMKFTTEEVYDHTIGQFTGLKTKTS